MPGSGHRPSVQRLAAPRSHLPVPFGPPARRPGCCHSRDFRLEPEARALRPVVTPGRLLARARHRSGEAGGGGCDRARPGASFHVGGCPGIFGDPRPGSQCLAADLSAATARAALPWWRRVRERPASRCAGEGRGRRRPDSGEGRAGRGEGETAACRSGVGREVSRRCGAAEPLGAGVTDICLSPYCFVLTASGRDVDGTHRGGGAEKRVRCGGISAPGPIRI